MEITSGLKSKAPGLVMLVTHKCVSVHICVWYQAIVDRDTMEPVPKGFQGEILLGGHGIALGYLNLPDKTAEKFITVGGMERLIG